MMIWYCLVGLVHACRNVMSCIKALSLFSMLGKYVLIIITVVLFSFSISMFSH